MHSNSDLCSETKQHFVTFCRRKASVDENYEWDSADFCSQPENHDGESYSLYCFRASPSFGKCS